MYVLLDIIEYVMINSTSHHPGSSIPFGQASCTAEDDLLDPVDQLLEDPALVDLVQQCLAGTFPPQRAPGDRHPSRVACCAVVS